MTFLRTLLATITLGLAVASCGSGDKPLTAPAGSVKATAAPQGQDWTQTVSKTPADGYVMGNPNAPLKLVEYGSRTCPTCGNFGRTGMQPLINNYVKSGKVSYEFRDFMVHGSADFAPSLLGRCVGTDAFFPVLEQMYVDQEQFLNAQLKVLNDQAFAAKIQAAKPTEAANLWADAMGYVEFMKQRGLPEAQVRACLNDGKALEALTKMMQSDEAKQVTGTPTFFLNGRHLPATTVTWDGVESALKAAGA